MSLKQRLARWHEAGLIDASQVDRITAFEAEDRTSARWLIWCVAAVGGLAIAAGIISVIAANWDDIPAMLKLGVAVAFLAALPVAAWRLGDRADGWPRDLVLFVHQLFVLATIGLVAQVFHLSGAPWRPFAVATAFAVPVAIAGGRALLVELAIVYAFVTTGAVLDQYDLLDPLFEHSMQCFTLGASIGAVFYCGYELFARNPKVALALRQLGLILLFICLSAASIRWMYDDPRPGREQMIGFIALPIALAAVFGTFRSFTPVRVIGAMSAAALLLGPELLVSERSLATKMVGFVLTVALCLAWAFIAADLGKRGQVNVATLLMSLRIIVAFFDLFDSLMNTGVGLLLTGVVLIGVSYGWWRLRGAIPVAQVAR